MDRRWRGRPRRCSPTRSGCALALGCYAAAFGAARLGLARVLPGLPAGQSWAALHVSLLGNHVLPLRLGEVLRVTSVLRRTALPAAAGDRLGGHAARRRPARGARARRARGARLVARLVGPWLVGRSALLVAVVVGAAGRLVVAAAPGGGASIRLPDAAGGRWPSRCWPGCWRRRWCGRSPGSPASRWRSAEAVAVTAVTIAVAGRRGDARRLRHATRRRRPRRWSRSACRPGRRSPSR